MEVLQSLRQNLLSGEMHHSLSRRVLIAKELAKSVSYVHNFEFVHKHICPETILLFEDLTSRFSTFLVGFDNFRSADGSINFTGDVRWERNLYRHPSRQGEFPEEAYKMQHDLYSLGVCLLEIGLWESFVSYSSDPKPVPRHGDAYQQFTKWLETTEAIPLPQRSSIAAYQSTITLKLKDYFVHLAKTRLPIAMGDKYSAVVVTCLTCLDKDNEDFGDENEMSDEEGILVAVRFIEKILLKLNEISV
jgi:serine/threonine protein kinase